MGLSFTIAAGPRQRINSRVRVPWYSQPYFTVSDSRLPFYVSSYDSQGYGGGIRPRLHTEIRSLEVEVTLRLTVSQSVSFGVGPHLGLMTRYLLFFDSYGLVFVGRPLSREDGSVCGIAQSV
jgi:hypothetical protein